jgi:hypothetical protein
VWIFNRPPDQLQETDVRELIGNRVREGIGLDFKREMYGGSEAEIRKMLRDVTALANANGGILLLGMDEDGEGSATNLVPVPRAEAEANRLVSSCVANVSERIPGLVAVRVPIEAGAVVVVWVPRSYRKPHMITFQGATEFWIRHDRQNARMSIAEIRTAVTATEDLEMKAQRFIDSRIRLPRPGQDPALMFTATPLLLEDGRVNVEDERVSRLLRTPPTFRPGRGVALTTQGFEFYPTLRGLAGTVPGGQTLEIFRNGHVEFSIFRHDNISEQREGYPGRVLPGWAIAEYLWSFTQFVTALRAIAEVAEPYLLAVALFHCHGVNIAERGLDMWGRGAVNRWDEAEDMILEPTLVPILEPTLVPVDEPADRTAQRVADRFWNGFHFARCPFFDHDARLRIPE